MHVYKKTFNPVLIGAIERQLLAESCLSSLSTRSGATHLIQQSLIVKT